MGDRLSATKVDIHTAKDSVTAISINNLPINPLIKTSGKNTATRTTVVAKIAKATCLDPL